MGLLPFGSHPKSAFKVVAVEPSSGNDGDTILVSSTNTVEVMWGIWQTVATLTPRPSIYYLQEDNSSRLLLEDGSGFYKQES
jgi:hypothetical protein